MSSRFHERLGTGFRMPFAERADDRDSRLDRALIGAWASATQPLSSRLVRQRLSRLVQRVELAESEVAPLSGEALRAAADDLRRHCATSTDAATVRAFALGREAARRHRGLRHFPVQLLGGAVMMWGGLAEMQTGEGKTLTAVLPAVAAALSGRRVHVVTVNDYLARRDATDLAPTYRALGLSVGLVEHGQSAEARRRAYASDITYCTNKELVFDYLRDRLTLGHRHQRTFYKLDQMLKPGAERSLLLRGLHFAIVDEADSVLVDEARTPLILSGLEDQAADDATMYVTALDVVARLVPMEDFHLLPEERRVRLSPDGMRRVRDATAGLGGIWEVRRARDEIIRQALCALCYFQRDVQYIVSGGKVEIVDEFTGRVMPDRSWEHGMHQLIEAKEGCAITARKGTLQKITYQHFFRRYRHLCGMTGTAVEVAGELQAVFGLRTVKIPTNRPGARRDEGARVFVSSPARWRAVVDRAASMVGVGRAVLIGTRSVEASEHISRLLTEAGHEHVVLNARQDGDEATVIAAAGRPGRITVATNMAGRGTDIILDPAVRANGGLHVILTEFHESRRIDRQLWGRAGRQGDPGSHEAIVSLSDELFQRFCGARLIACAQRLAGSSQLVPQSVGSALRRIAQSTAERVHGRSRREAFEAARRSGQALGFAGKG